MEGLASRMFPDPHTYNIVLGFHLVLGICHVSDDSSPGRLYDHYNLLAMA